MTAMIMDRVPVMPNTNWKAPKKEKDKKKKKNISSQ